jgi:hypothetical protein
VVSVLQLALCAHTPGIFLAQVLDEIDRVVNAFDRGKAGYLISSAPFAP